MKWTKLDNDRSSRRFASIVAMMAGVIAMALTGATGAWAGTPLGPDAQLFGMLASDSVALAHSSTVSDVSQAPAPPEVGAGTADIAGPTSYLTGDLITSAATGLAISLGDYDTVVGECVTGGGTILSGTGAACGGYDSSGTNARLTTLSNAQSEAATYASYLAGLTPTTTLGDITLKKYQRLTVKLGAGVNVVSIGNITTAGGNTIMLSAPKGAVVVINVSGTLDLGAGTQVFTTASGLDPHNVVWNIESANPTFGAGVTLRGTAINVASGTTVTFGGRSAIIGALLTNGAVVTNGAMHLNFWPFTAAP